MSAHARCQIARDGAVRVGFLTPTLILGGAGRWITSLARHLPAQSDQRIAVTMVAVVNNVPTERSLECERETGQYASIVHGVEALDVLAAQSDVIVVWGVRSLERLPPFRGPVVFVGHGHCQWTVLSVQGCLPRVTHWTAVSQAATLSFPEPSRVTVIHNGVESDRCQPTISREEVRAAWGLAKEEIAVGYVGRFSPEKNPIDCARAVRVLGKPYRAVYAGNGWRRDEVLREVRDLAPDAIYSPTVLHVGDVLAGLDCFLLTSPSEGFSLALAEAWQCGCPAVCTPVGALPELEPIHGKMAVSVPVNATPDDLATAIRLAVLPENFPVVDRAARVVRAHFTAEAMAKRWAEYLLSIA